MKKLTVELNERSYPIFIGTNLLSNPSLINPFVKGNQVLIVSNQTIAPIYLEKVRQLFTGFTVEKCILKDGEQYKNFNSVNEIYNKLLALRFDRTCTLVALGGGVIGDITGFAAATYQRGVNFIQIPTTLLSQVDSSVGGKTGVNHPMGKNMIGAFYQPQCVVIDLTTLKTLKSREIPAGLAEIIKYGLINDLDFFEWLEQNIDALLNLDEVALRYAVFKSCENKANIVANDEKESGIRATLNLGHTFGHAIEAHQGYGQWLHGEAVGVGMIMAGDLSWRLGWLNKSDLKRIFALIQSAKLPVKAPKNMNTADFLSYMSVDKKTQAGKIKLILLKSIGHAVISGGFSSEDSVEPNMFSELLKTLDNVDKI